MSETSDIRATPFHGRAAARNLSNRWTSRNGFTLSLDYGDAHSEALAARANAVLIDISWRWRAAIVGGGADECLSRLMTRNVGHLTPGQSLKALWLNDGGAVRGAGVIARFASEEFQLVSAADDTAWFEAAARQFGVSLRDVTGQEGGLALVGPYAEAIMKAARFDADLSLLEFRKLSWRGLDVTVSRWGEQNGFEIWCKADDCFTLWDRLMRAGAPFGLRPAGAAAADILDIEAGIPRPGRDYLPTADGFVSTPTPEALGLDALIDEAHIAFNGRKDWLAGRASEKRALIGVELDSERPAPFVPLIKGSITAGSTLSSVYSPVLRRAIALASVTRALAGEGTEFVLTIPASLENPAPLSIAARAVSMPMVAPPDSIVP